MDIFNNKLRSFATIQKIEPIELLFVFVLSDASEYVGRQSFYLISFTCSYNVRIITLQTKRIPGLQRMENRGFIAMYEQKI